jgi:hypothetical protein
MVYLGLPNLKIVDLSMATLNNQKVTIIMVLYPGYNGDIFFGHV